MTQEGNNILVHISIHIPELVIRFHFINNQRIFLFQVGRLHTLFQVVHGTQVLFPGIIDYSQRDTFFQRIGQFCTLRGNRLIQVGKYIQGFASVCKWHHHIFDMAALCVADIFENRNRIFLDFFFMLVIGLRSFRVQLIDQFVDVALLEFFFTDSGIQAEIDDTGHPESFEVFLFAEGTDQAFSHGREGGIDIQCQAFSK